MFPFLSACIFCGIVCCFRLQKHPVEWKFTKSYSNAQQRFHVIEDDLKRTCPQVSSGVVDHLAYASLKYLPRPAVSSSVCSSFYRRTLKRNASEVNSCDKEDNYLTAIVGPHGCGLSTTLAHLPQSTAYRNYHRARQIDSSRLKVSPEHPVVSLVNCNRTTTGRIEAVGLLIIYSALQSMSLLSSNTLSWPCFLAKYSSAENMTCLEAVND